MTLDRIRTASGRAIRRNGLVPFSDVRGLGDSAPAPGLIRLVQTNAPEISTGDKSPFPFRRLALLEPGGASFRVGVASSTQSAQFITRRARPFTGPPGAVQNGDSIGRYTFSARMPNVPQGPVDPEDPDLGLLTNHDGAFIEGRVDGVPSVTSYPLRMDFFTTPEGSTTSMLAMRLTAAGHLLLGNTTGTQRLSVTGNVQLTDPANGFRIGTDQVLGARRTGWAAPTGTASRAGFDTATATPAQVAEGFKALVDDLIAHGLIGA